MARWRRSRKSPGGAPLTDKRELYIKLMNQGESNSAACRAVGINRKTGTRWGQIRLSYPAGERRWRREHDLPQVRRHLPRSWTTAGRRERHIRDKAERLGISFDEAERMTPKRPAGTRSGRRKAAQG